MESKEIRPSLPPFFVGGCKPPHPRTDGVEGAEPLLNNSGKSSILLPYQQRWVNDGSPLKIWLAARQVGKSFAVSMEAVALSLLSKCTNLILSSSERQSKEVMEKVYSHLRYLKPRSFHLIFPVAETREEARLPNGSRIISLPANPDTVRGFSGNVFLDEFAFHGDADEIWRAMYPAVTRGFKARITSTPNGKSNLFHDLWLKNEGFSKHKTDIYEAVAEGLRVDVENLRLGIGDPDAWAQEYECRFVDEATAYITYEMIASCEDEGATREIMFPPAHPYYLSGGSAPTPPMGLQAPDPDRGSVGAGGPVALGGGRGGEAPSGLNGRAGGDFFLGVDIGRKRDLTVFWLWEKVGDVFWTRMVKEMHKAPFREQREFLFSLLEGFPPAPQPKSGLKLKISRACIDATGLGMQLAEEAEERFGARVEAVRMTSAVKEDLAVTFRRRFEDRLLRIPIDRDIREDIHGVKKFTTSAGNVRFDAERTEEGHADRFWAGALGVHAGAAGLPVIEYETTGKRGFKGFEGYLK